MKILWKEWIFTFSILAQNILPRERYTTSLVFKRFMPTVIWSYRNFSTMVMKIMLEESVAYHRHQMKPPTKINGLSPGILYRIRFFELTQFSSLIIIHSMLITTKNMIWMMPPINLLAGFLVLQVAFTKAINNTLSHYHHSE